MSRYQEKKSETKTIYNVEFIGPLYKTTQEVKNCLEKLEEKVWPRIEEADKAKRAAHARAHTKMLD